MDISSVANSAKEYIGMYTAPINDITSILALVTGKYSTKVYSDETKLKEAMKEFGANEIQIAKVILMTQVTGTRELLEMDTRMQQNDLDRYVQNVIKETGFNRAQILELTSAIVMSLGTSFNFKIPETKEDAINTAFVIPVKIYEDELRKIAYPLAKMEYDKISDKDLTKLEALASAGIPKAKYYLGCYFLKKEKNSPFGLQMLEEAAAEGDSDAAATLGDYYYKQGTSMSWQKAYDYYTGHGALALTENRREAMLNIINHKTFNRKMLGASILLAILALAMLVFAPGATIYAAHRVFGSICFIGLVAVIAVAIMHYRVSPYDSVYWVPCSMFVIWCIYVAARLFF